MTKKHTHTPLKTEWYYKTADGKHWYQVTHQLIETGLVEVTKAEWDQHFAGELEKKAKRQQIATLKKFLADTDYIVVKIAEETDASKVAALRETYADVIAERKQKRAQIDSLLEKLK